MQKEKFFLKARVLTFEFMHIVRAELEYFHLLSDGVQKGITHKERSRVNS